MQKNMLQALIKSCFLEANKLPKFWTVDILMVFESACGLVEQ